MSASARRFLLRDRTTDAHAALDAAVGPLDSHAAYDRYLLGIYAFRAPVERALAGRPDAPRPLAPLIAADLAEAGLPAEAEEAFIAPADHSGLAGIGYVLAGSALGARILRRQVQGLGLDPAHLAAQTEDKRAWPDFCAHLETLDPFDADAATAAAVATFAFAQRAFRAADA